MSTLERAIPPKLELSTCASALGKGFLPELGFGDQRGDMSIELLIALAVGCYVVWE